MRERLNPRIQGARGELSAMEWLDSQGYYVFFPVNHSPDVDLVAVRGADTLRVQVKTSTATIDNGRYAVHVCTSGGNQSWNGIVKFWVASACDFLFVLLADGRRYFIPSDRVEGRRSIAVGGPKYAEYEVERGRPLLRAVVD